MKRKYSQDDKEKGPEVCHRFFELSDVEDIYSDSESKFFFIFYTYRHLTLSTSEVHILMEPYVYYNI